MAGESGSPRGRQRGGNTLGLENHLEEAEGRRGVVSGGWCQEGHPQPNFSLGLREQGVAGRRGEQGKGGSGA